MSEYWQKRFEMLEDARNRTAKETVRSVTPAFDKAQAQIEKEIDAWYARFAKNNQISLQEAKKLLNTKELKEFRWDVQEYIKYGRENAIDQKWMKELENASSRFHISRLEALKIHTQNAAEQAFGNELDALDEMSARVYMDDYYHTAYEIQKGLGIGWDVSKIDQRKLDSILSKPWTADKQTFSDRIWKSKTQLLDSLHTELTQMCILGKSPDQTINNIAKRMDVSKSQAGRLVMTEAAYFGSAAQKDCFNDLDVERYEIVATLDGHTSEICQKMDGKVFDMKDFQAGVTAPPFHCWCRSCTAPYFEDADDMRAARDENGNTYYVPANMKYQDWKDHFVDKTKDPADWLRPATVEDVAEAVKKFVPAKTIAEAEEYARQWAKNVSYAGAKDLDAVNEVNRTLLTLHEQCPVDELSNIITNRRLTRAEAQANYSTLEIGTKWLNSVGTTSPDDWAARVARNREKIEQCLEFTDSKKYPPSTVKAYKKYIKQLENECKYSRWTVSSSHGVGGTITHEYGHIIADQYFGQINRTRANSHFSFNKDNPLWLQEKYVTEVFEMAKKNGDIRSISMYAATDAHEFFAESFTMHMMGESLPDYIEEMVKKVISDGKL